jgi:hypothetical protein
VRRSAQVGLLGIVLALLGAVVVAAQTPPDTAKKAAPSPYAEPGEKQLALLGPADTTVIPILDRGRAIDAELRVALFDLMTDRPVTALSHLRRLDPSGADSAAGAAWRQPAERQFLIAECYYRLAMDDSLRTEAELVLNGPGAARFGPVLRPQLLLAAYRQGDYARVVELSRAFDAAGKYGGATTGEGGAPALFAGLAAYRLGDVGLAQLSFDAARRDGAGGPYATYAEYMTVLMDLKSDTSHRAAAMAVLDTMIPHATGAAADQLRLTQAQLAYESGQYDRATQEASGVPTDGALGAAALMTTAWSQYRAGHIQPAADAFAQFGQAYPELPGHDESRLMYAQSALQLHNEDSASRAFRAVTDLVTSEAQAMGADGSGLRGGGRLLVNARVADVLLLGDVAGGKAIAFPDSAAAGTDALRVAVSDAPGASTSVPVPSPVSITDLLRRLDDAGVDSAGVAKAGVAAGAVLLRRAIFMAPPDAASGAELARDVASLHDADVGVAVAREEATEKEGYLQLQLANLHRMHDIIAAAGDSLAPGYGVLGGQEDSLAKVSASVDSAGERLGRLFTAQVTALRTLARENETSIDSVSGSLSSSSSQSDRDYLDRERQSAAVYARMADEVTAGVQKMVFANPAFALRDTVRQRGERIRALIVQTRRAIVAGEAAVDEQIALVGASDSGQRGKLQAAVLAADARRDSAANVLVTAVDRELNARALALVAELSRDREAAEFGSASALFFRAIRPPDAAPTPPSAGSGR